MKGKKGRHEEVFAKLKRDGFVRVRVDGETHLLEEVPELDKKKAHSIDVVVDRLVLPCDRTRLTDSVELVLKTGGGVLKVELLRSSPAATSIVPAASRRAGAGQPTPARLPAPRSEDAAGAVLGAAGTVLDAAGTVGASEITFSELNACPHCGVSFDELKPRSFSFNSPFGACPTCGGLGQLYYFDEDLVVPDKSLPLRECIHPWRRAGHNAIMY